MKSLPKLLAAPSLCLFPDLHGQWFYTAYKTTESKEIGRTSKP